MRTLLGYRKNHYSQNGEDGVIEEILKRIGIKQGWFVEFGAWDGKHLSNTYALVEKGWKGVEIEGGEKKISTLQKRFRCNTNITPICAYVSEEGDNSLDYILSKTTISKDFDLISIDIDPYDWQIWKSLKNYKPKIVIIEINSSIPPGIEQIHSPTENKQGSSFTSTLNLGIQKGYYLVCHTGNLIFIRDDLVWKLNLPKAELKNPKILFISDWIPKIWIVKFIVTIYLFMEAVQQLPNN
jgi:hypothetical protein